MTIHYRVDDENAVDSDPFKQAEKEFDRLRSDASQRIGRGKTVAGGTATPTGTAPHEPQKDYAKGARLLAAKTTLGPDERIVRYDWSGNHKGKDAAVCSSPRNRAATVSASPSSAARVCSVAAGSIWMCVEAPPALDGHEAIRTTVSKVGT